MYFIGLISCICQIFFVILQRNWLFVQFRVQRYGKISTYQNFLWKKFKKFAFLWKIVGKMNDRLRKFLDFQGISVRQFEAMIGSSDGKIAKFMATNSSLKSDTLSKVMEVFPQLSIEWLISGEGEMLKSPSDSSQPNTKELRRNSEG